MRNRNAETSSIPGGGLLSLSGGSMLSKAASKIYARDFRAWWRKRIRRADMRFVSPEGLAIYRSIALEAWSAALGEDK